MDEFILNDFLSGFDDGDYPEAFLQKYELVECLASNPMGETFLIRDRFKAHFVAKCYTDPSLLSRTTENILLKNLHHDGLPAFVEEFRNESMLCVVRQYMTGTPLSRLEKPLSEKQIISIGVQLCDILCYLHAQTMPVIHRDIKPQNIILSDSGKVTLIDFGISRLYDKNARTDTAFFGTQEFAPPEQYGFTQTDCRADIFSLGVVLAWLLTGKTRVNELHINNKRMARVVKKCTAFAPKDRYPDAKRVKRALIKAGGYVQKKAACVCCAVLALLAALTTGFAIGRFTDVRPALFYNNAYAHFSEPLVETAVRLQLGKSADVPILAEELDAVTELYIYADQTAKTWEDCNTLRGQVDSGVITAGNGSVSALDDIVKLKNLRRLSLGNQGFTDISVLAALNGLELLEFFNCPIQDISAVGKMTALRHFVMDNCDGVTDVSPLANLRLNELVLSNCNADDFSFLAELGDFKYLHMPNVDPELFLAHLEGKTVKQLKLGYTALSSVSDLAGINGIEELLLYQMQLPSLAGIERLDSLAHISLLNMPHLNLETLLALPYLNTVTLSQDMSEAGSMIKGENFEIIYQ